MNRIRIDLIDLLYEFEEAQSLHRLVVMTKIRHYITTQPMIDTIDEIHRLTKPEHLNILIGVGMPSVLYYAVVAQKAKLMGVA